MTFETYINKLDIALSGKLPGKEAQMLMSPSDRGERFRSFAEQENAKNSAILILLYPKNGEAHTVFIQRNTYNGHHSGQIAMPGGKSEQGDKDHTATALREAQEEIGIISNDVKVIGSLSKLYIPVSNINVYPIVGYIDYEPDIKVEPDEVQQALPFAISRLIDKNTVQSEILKIKEFEINAPYYNINGHHLWGATAMIMAEFVEIVKSSL